MARDIYIAIKKADAGGRGLRLTAEEVTALSRDEAINMAACNALTQSEIGNGYPDWRKISDRRSNRR